MEEAYIYFEEKTGMKSLLKHLSYVIWSPIGGKKKSENF